MRRVQPGRFHQDECPVICTWVAILVAASFTRSVPRGLSPVYFLRPATIGAGGTLFDNLSDFVFAQGV